MPVPSPEPPIPPVLAETKACPDCGTAQEDWTRVCPHCQHLWPDGREDGTQARLSQFQQQLAHKAPTPWLTLGIIGLNVAIYLGMLAAGISPMEPGIPELLRWGANLGSLTTSGEWWRLLTCTFLHIGLFHLLFNMWVLWDIGRFMERLLGRAGFATLYLLSGLAGSIASMWWNPYIVSAGASGAVFGLYGGLLGCLVAGRGTIPDDVGKGLRKNALLFLGYNLVWGLMNQGIDMAGHLGGLVGGLACGLALIKGRAPGGDGTGARVPLQVLAAGLGLLALVAGLRPKTVDLRQELARFAITETQVQARYNQALEQVRAGHLGDAAFANLVEAEVIAPWHAARLRLQTIQGLPATQAQALSRIERYTETRERAWSTFAEALRQQDPKGIQQAAALHAEAEAQLKELGP